MSEPEDDKAVQPSVLIRADEIQEQIQQLSGRDLQLWSITPDGPVSIGLMRGGDVHRFRIAPATTRLAVTSEPRGGSVAPTGNPIVSGALPAT